MNTEPMTIPEIALEYVLGGLADPPAPSNDTPRPTRLTQNSTLGGYAAPGGTLGGYAGGSDAGSDPVGK